MGLISSVQLSPHNTTHLLLECFLATLTSPSLLLAGSPFTYAVYSALIMALRRTEGRVIG